MSVGAIVQDEAAVAEAALPRREAASRAYLRPPLPVIEAARNFGDVSLVSFPRPAERNGDVSLVPSPPAGERVGVRGMRRRAPHLALRADLSPPGRGDFRRRDDDVRVLYPGPDSLMIRSARPADTPRIFELLESFAARGLLLRRTFGQVRGMIDDFVVAVEPHGRVLGCGALRVYSDTLAEVAALAVDESRQGRGVGARIVRVLEAEATALGIRRLFALTLQDGFFRRLGFGVADVRDFPEKIARDCTRCAHRFHCVEIAVTRELRSEGSPSWRIASEA